MMPVAFIGHGSPMNAIQTNEFTKGWQEIAASIPKPAAILAISAHWCTEGTYLSDGSASKTVHDFFGFPRELYQIEYLSPSSPVLAHKAIDLIGGTVREETGRGLDHGVWSILRVMYPNADIPVFQMSIDEMQSPESLYQMGQKLKPLREENVLILGSGNVVHNPSRLSSSTKGGYDWACEFDDYIRENVEKRAFDNVIHYEKAGQSAADAFVTPEHFNPLLYILGAADETDKLGIFNKACMAGSLSMTSYVFAA